MVIIFLSKTTLGLPLEAKEVRNKTAIPHFPVPIAAGVCAAYGGAGGIF
jgi:hypothetical protein